MERLTRRTFAVDLARSAVGLFVFSGLSTACSQGGGAATPEPRDGPGTGDGQEVFRRIDLGFVSAWIVLRGGQAAIVDTGVEGSEGAIEEGLAAVGLGFGDVSDVVLTHRHPDHQGSTPAVLAAATGATAWAGAADVAAITSPRPVQPLEDGDRVFDLDVVATPGHTPGHICLLDAARGLLFTGDALNGADGGVVGPNPEFTADMEQALASVRRLAELDFEAALFGHGEPVLTGADAAVRALA